MKLAFILSLLLASFSCHGQYHNTCKIFEFFGSDSSHQQLAAKKIYNSKGRVSFIEIEKLHTDLQSYYPHRRQRNLYKDTALVSSTYIDDEGDCIKTKYNHDASGHRTRETRYTSEYRIRKGVDKGLWGKDGCVVTAADYEKKRSWKKVSRIDYTYDKRGNRITYDATKLHYSSQNRYTWSYDSDSRITECSSFNDQRLIWTEKFTYFEGGYKYSRCWYDADGKPQHLKPENEGYHPLYTFTYQMNRKNKVIEITCINEKGGLNSKESFLYDKQNRLIRDVRFSPNGTIELTHIYTYE